jgi:hypothetical protein
MEPDRAFEIAGWLIWSTMAAVACISIWHYFRTKRANLAFWQFTIKQFLVLIAIWALLFWMLYTWVVVPFFTPFE